MSVDLTNSQHTAILVLPDGWEDINVVLCSLQIGERTHAFRARIFEQMIGAADILAILGNGAGEIRIQNEAAVQAGFFPAAYINKRMGVSPPLNEAAGDLLGAPPVYGPVLFRRAGPCVKAVRTRR